MSKRKKEVIKLSGKTAFINSANKLNRSMPEVSRGCGIIGDTKYNRNKSKKAIRREIEGSRDGFFYLLISSIAFSTVSTIVSFVTSITSPFML